jgi:cell division topological specificity factor
MRNLFQKLEASLEEILGRGKKSKEDAKQRLKFLLIHDQVDLSPAQLDQMRDEIMAVVARYLEVDTTGVEFKLNREEGQIALVSSVPVRRVTTRAPAA